MYSAVLLVHSWLRWVVLLSALFVLVRSFMSRRAPWASSDDRAMVLFISALDLQMLLGLLLYAVLSPATQAAFEDFGAAMRTGSLRFWAVEHLTGMIIAIALAHVGRARVKKAAAADKRGTALLFTLLAVLVLALSIPWPGMANGRPLFRFSL